MSAEATQWAWSVSGLSAATKLTLLSMCRRADETNKVAPTWHRLIADTGLTRETVRKSISTLVSNHLITDTLRREGATQQIVVYRLSTHLTAGREDDDENNDKSAPLEV